MLSLLTPRRKNMENVLTADQTELIKEYRRVIAKIHQARNGFENITEPELIESCVHEMNALQSQYSFLLQRIKEEKLTADMQ